MKNKRIAIYTGELPPPTFVDRLILGLAEQGHTIYLFGAIQKGMTNYPKNIKVIGYTNKWSKIVQLLKYSLLLYFFKNADKKKIDNIIKNGGNSTYLKKMKYYPIIYHHPDIFHLQWVKGISDWIWIKEFNMKLVVSLRGAHINYSPICHPEIANQYRTCFPDVDFFHAVSNEIEKEASKYGDINKKTKVIYSGLPILKNNNFEISNSSGTVNIISIGRGHWIKGYSYALDAMSILKQKGFKFTYTIIGLGQNEELLFQRNQLGLNNEVTFIDKVPFEKVEKYLIKSHILLLSSTKEGIANVVIEAMALGVQVVSTDCGGISELISHKENGFIVPIRDPLAIAEAIVYTQSLTIENKTNLIEKAKNKVESQHEIKRMIQAFNELYEQWDEEFEK
jgi:colanic acid/amylovoran biosynthesis glycosyltransferase